jgi:hypothetical protein
LSIACTNFQAILCADTTTAKIITHSYFIRTIAQLKLQTASPPGIAFDMISFHFIYLLPLLNFVVLLLGYPSTWQDNQNGCSRSSDYAMVRRF